MKIENLENLQEINTEEFSSLQGGMMIRNDMEMMEMMEMKARIIDPHPPMPEEKPEPKPIRLPRRIHRCYPPLPHKCIPGHPPFCAIPL
ncbi:MAG: hypothetical protein F6J90_27465 [Moorea sp. SIOASIH]|uniref:hypothetical protein n=1 Tax=Moorena sp. SIOASIH TaxID=2607817 RepID=UPI0013B934B7|nr:hypothetical protein [Moorena sp. SIOASIH]NEO39869.1 hypothetical protein [Moorena sp. SIOASIH]NEO95585.1 hypothetical protein [Moorena sp. SIO3G5]